MALHKLYVLGAFLAASAAAACSSSTSKGTADGGTGGADSGTMMSAGGQMSMEAGMSMDSGKCAPDTDTSQCHTCITSTCGDEWHACLCSTACTQEFPCVAACLAGNDAGVHGTLDDCASNCSADGSGVLDSTTSDLFSCTRGSGDSGANCQDDCWGFELPSN